MCSAMPTSPGCGKPKRRENDLIVYPISSGRINKCIDKHSIVFYSRDTQVIVVGSEWRDRSSTFPTAYTAFSGYLEAGYVFPNEPKSYSATAYRRGGRQLTRIWKYLVEAYSLDPLKDHPELKLLQDRMHEVEAAAIKSDRLVAVYRKDQPRWQSPCQLGTPCLTCRTHAPCLAGTLCRGCRRGKAFQCERATPASPAFWLSFKDALLLKQDGLADLRDGNTTLQLNFSRLAHLRDASCKIDRHFLEALIGDHFDEASQADLRAARRARAALIFWGNTCGDYVEWTPERMAASEAEIRSFV